MHKVAHPQELSSPEFQLLVATCRWPAAASNSLPLDIGNEGKIRWERFLHIVDRHRVAGLVHNALSLAEPGRVPADVMAAIQQRFQRQTMQCLIAAGEAVRLTALLDHEGIPCITLKGPSLAMLAYGSLALRHCKDNDLLVSRPDVSRAHAILTEAGYRREKPADLINDRHMRIYMRHRHQFEYVHERSKMQVDLHWRLYENNALARIDPRLLDDTQIISLGAGRSVRTLPDDALCAYLCVHGAMHGWFRLKWLADIHAMLSRSPEAASRALDTCASLGVQRAAQQALQLCHLFWNTPLPARMTPSGWTSRRLVSIACEAMTSENDAGSPTGNPAGPGIEVSHLLFSSRPRYLWHEIGNILMLPDDWAQTPAGVRFLYPLIRILRWMIGKLRRPLHPRHLRAADQNE